jgi:hypothetical protein
MQDESHTSTPDPSGALVPPDDASPATTTTALLPNPDGEAYHRVQVEPTSNWQQLLASSKALVNAVLDVTDVVVDRVAEAVGLRRESVP